MMPTATAHEELRKIADFDHPFRVNGDGTLASAPLFHAPSVYHIEEGSGDVEIDGDGWETFSDGYTGQYSYSGPVMHASEYLGGRLADDILEAPGVYVVTSVEVLPTDEDPEPFPAGWIVLRLAESEDI